MHGVEWAGRLEGSDGFSSFDGPCSQEQPADRSCRITCLRAQARASSHLWGSGIPTECEPFFFLSKIAEECDPNPGPKAHLDCGPINGAG